MIHKKGHRAMMQGPNPMAGQGISHEQMMANRIREAEKFKSLPMDEQMKINPNMPMPNQSE